MNLQDHISRLSPRFNLPTNLVRAIAKVESNLEMSAIRHEPHYRWLWDNEQNKPFRTLDHAEIGSAYAPTDFYAVSDTPGFYSSDHTEWMGQRTSWGPFQVMGGVLRERGYKDAFPKMCIDPELATRFALTQLSKLRDRYYHKHGWAGVAAAYNAGRPRKDENGRYLNREYLVKIHDNGGRNIVHYV